MIAARSPRDRGVSSDLITPTGSGVASNLRPFFRPLCRLDFVRQTDLWTLSKQACLRRHFSLRNGRNRFNWTMSKNPQKHWDLSKCAGLRRVVSLSAMRARAWKTTKVPSATRRTRRVFLSSSTRSSSPLSAPNESLPTEVRDAAFTSRTTLRHVARALSSCPPSRLPDRGVSGATVARQPRLPLWHSLAITRDVAWVLPQKTSLLRGVGTATNQHRVCFVCPKFSPTIKGLNYDHDCFAD